MAHVPQKIYERIATAKKLYDASTKFPPPTNYAAEILLLISGWENVILAEKELEAWARGEAIDPKLLRDHIAKLNEVDEHSYVLRVIVSPPGKGIPAKEVYYRDGKSLLGIQKNSE